LAKRNPPGTAQKQECREREEAQILAVLYCLLGFTHLHLGDYNTAWEYGKSSLEIAEKLHFRFEAAFARLLLGSAALATAHYDRARSLLTASAQTFRELDHVEYLGWALPLLGLTACTQGQWQPAQELLAEAGDLLSRLSAFAPRMFTLASLALWQAGRGRVADAAGAYALAEAAFVGGSLENLGGQNFLEPLVFGLKPIIGPYWKNFAWVGREIIDCGLVEEVADEKELVTALLKATDTVLSQDAVIKEVQAFLEPRKGGTHQVCQQIIDTLAVLGQK